MRRPFENALQNSNKRIAFDKGLLGECIYMKELNLNQQIFNIIFEENY
jgi:hypothetical protein